MLINYSIYSEDQPLVISRKALRIAIEQHPELEQDIYSVIRRGIVRIAEED